MRYDDLLDIYDKSVRSIEGKALIMIEGTDMSGKSYFARRLYNSLSESNKGNVYKQSAEINQSLGPILGYNNLVSLAITQMDILSSQKKSELIQDRGIISSIYHDSSVSKYYDLYHRYATNYKLILIHLDTEDDTSFFEKRLDRGEISVGDPTSASEYLKSKSDFDAKCEEIYSNICNLFSYNMYVRYNPIKDKIIQIIEGVGTNEENIILPTISLSK